MDKILMVISLEISKNDENHNNFSTVIIQNATI
jgi:hypothetical protein